MAWSSVMSLYLRRGWKITVMFLAPGLHTNFISPPSIRLSWAPPGKWEKGFLILLNNVFAALYVKHEKIVQHKIQMLLKICFKWAQPNQNVTKYPLPRCQTMKRAPLNYDLPRNDTQYCSLYELIFLFSNLKSILMCKGCTPEHMFTH